MAESKNYIPALKYDWLTQVYDHVLQFTMPEKKFKIALIDQMGIQPGNRVLDFGCGSLTLSIMAAQTHPHAEFHGVDIDDKILSIAKEKLKDTEVNIHIQNYDGGRLPYPDGHFSKIMSSLVFHHLTLQQKYAALDEMHRVLKPGGELHIADFGKPSNVFQRIGFYTIQCLDGFETTRDSVKYLLPTAMRDSGFAQVEEVNYFNTIVGTVRLLGGIKQNGVV